MKTETFNARAKGFYEANGFEQTGFSSEDVNGESVDLVVLGRNVGG